MNVIQVGASSNKRGFGQQLTVGNNNFLIDPEDAVTTDAKGNNLLFTNTPIVDMATVDPTGEACSALPANSLNGAIVLISLDGWDANDNCNPYDKMSNAQDAGAAGAIIYDTFPEDLDVFVSYYDSGYTFFSDSGIPAAFITRTDGLALKSQLASQPNATATLDFNFDSVPLSSDRLAFFSSRGPNVNYEIKPDMVAVGQFLFGVTETVNSVGDLYDSSGFLYPADGTSGSAPQVAGAAAILKSARPGLTASQYRSLLINSAAPISDVVAGGLARVMDTGAGLLDANAALNAEATVAPASLSFGIGNGSSTLNQTVTVTNSGTSVDTFNLTVAPRDPGFTPQISPASLQLAPGASGTVQVTIPGGVLQPGEYEGAIHVQANNTPTDTHIPYWFGIPSTSPYMIIDMGSDQTDTRSKVAQAAIVFRVNDASGIIMSNILSQIQMSVVQGNGKVSAPYALDDYSPGTIAVDVTMDSRRNFDNIFQAQIGNLSLQFTITGQ